MQCKDDVTVHMQVVGGVVMLPAYYTMTMHMEGKEVQVPECKLLFSRLVQGNLVLVPATEVRACKRQHAPSGECIDIQTACARCELQIPESRGVDCTTM